MNINKMAFIESALTFSLYEDDFGILTLAVFEETKNGTECLCCVPGIAPENVKHCLATLPEWPAWNGKFTEEEFKVRSYGKIIASTRLKHGEISGFLDENVDESGKKALAGFMCVD